MLVNIYPNPTHDILNIQLSQPESVQQIDVYTVSGKLVKSEKHITQTVHQINLGTMGRGLYIIRIITDSGIITRKVNKL